jgi:O-antigen/teichoic acid export membrane protein
MRAAASAWRGGRLLGLAGQNILLRRRVPWLAIGLRHGSWGKARALLGPAGAVMLVPIAQAMLLQGTAVVLGRVAGSAAVPAFAATRTISRIGLQLCWIVSTPLMPEFSAAMAREDRRAMATMLLALLMISALLVVPYAFGFMAAGQWLIGYWTHGVIVPPLPLVLAMGCTILFGGLWYPVSNLILACNRQAGYSAWYLAHVLARPLGAAGAGLAMALLDAAMLVVILVLARRVLPGRRELVSAMPLLRMRVARIVRRCVPA